MKITKEKSGLYNVWEIDKSGRKFLAARFDSLEEAKALIKYEKLHKNQPAKRGMGSEKSP